MIYYKDSSIDATDHSRWNRSHGRFWVWAPDPCSALQVLSTITCVRHDHMSTRVLVASQALLARYIGIRVHV